MKAVRTDFVLTDFVDELINELDHYISVSTGALRLLEKRDAGFQSTARNGCKTYFTETIIMSVKYRNTFRNAGKENNMH